MIAGPISQGPAFLKGGQAWNAASGSLNVMAGEVTWGPVSLSEANGELRTDGAGKWQGQIRGKGALKPEGVAVAGLTSPVTIDIIDNKPVVSGLVGLDLRESLPLGQ
jgi:hypothetical protein